MSKRILSVNGNKAMHYLLQTIFRNEFQVLPVMDVYKGMHILKADKEVELLIVDVDFEAEESWEMIHHVKTSRLYQVPVIVLTTSNNDTIKNKCYELGIDEVFFKPFNPVDLIAAVKSLQAATV
jgi:DNA-binding response OmpR family regulator